MFRCPNGWTWKSVITFSPLPLPCRNLFGLIESFLGRFLFYRFILANTEQLHDKISELSDRVRQLEEALEQVQAQCSNQRHPLLAPDLLKIKTSQELYGTTPFPPPPSLNADSSTVVSPSTRQTELGESVGALSLYPPTPMKFANQAQITDSISSSSTVDRPRYTTPPEVASDILQLSATFPFPWMVDLSMRKRIRDALPPREEAERICNEARNNALWQYVNFTYSNPPFSFTALLFFRLRLVIFFVPRLQIISCFDAFGFCRVSNMTHLDGQV